MPLRDEDANEARRRLLRMFMDTISVFEMIEKGADTIYGDRAPQMRAAIRECLEDFLYQTQQSRQVHPERLIYEASASELQTAGLYGAQLDLKERQVEAANRSLRERLSDGNRPVVGGAFRRWVDVINNFLGSVTAATGFGEALKELKDCLRDGLPDK